MVPMIPETPNALANINNQPWGEANARRGTPAMTEAAVRFVQAFPLGSDLTPEQFDAWSQANGYLTVPVGADKQSDAWKAFLQRRHEFRYKMNLAAAHPRLREFGATPFSLEAVRLGRWEVRAPHDAALKNDVARRVDGLVTTKRRRLSYLLQSADYSALPAYERMAAEMLHEDIAAFHSTIHHQSGLLESKFLKLQAKLKQAIESGNLVPRNHGIKALIAPEQTEIELAEEEADRHPE
jgi:hypothetical protein